MMRLDKYGLVKDLISVFESYPPMEKFYNKELDIIEVKPDQIENFITDLGKIFGKLIEANTSIDEELGEEENEEDIF